MDEKTKLSNEKILVTRATGQVARTLTEQLNQSNEVWAAARFSDAEAKKALEAQGVNTVYLNTDDSDMSALPDVDYVIHCGCNTFPKSQDEALRQNAEGTGFLMRRYKDVKAFFHMSSDSVNHKSSHSVSHATFFLRGEDVFEVDVHLNFFALFTRLRL